MDKTIVNALYQTRLNLVNNFVICLYKKYWKPLGQLFCDFSPWIENFFFFKLNFMVNNIRNIGIFLFSAIYQNWNLKNKKILFQ